MALDHRIITQLAKIINDNKNTNQNNESTIYGTVVDKEGGKYFKPDGSDQLIPITDSGIDPKASNAMVSTNYGDRISVLIKDHTATVTGNISSPSVSNSDVEKAITEFDIVVGEQIQANKGYFKDLTADKADMGNLAAAIISVAELIAKDVKMEELIAGKITVDDLIAKKIDTDVVIAGDAIIDKLKANNVDILSLIADKAVLEELIADDVDITSLEAQNAYLKYANIDFANINEAAIKKILADYGIVGELNVVKELVGVTIKGDLIEAGTLKADKLIVKGTDGNYYALNTDFTALPGVIPVEEAAIHGSVLVKESIVAEKLSVNELAALNATIGGFHIKGVEGNAPGAIYSGAKGAVDADSITGIYLDSEGQVAFGNSDNCLKFYKDTDGSYKLFISADNITFGAGKQFFLNDEGMTVEGASSDTNNTIKTVVSNNGMVVHSNNKDVLKANDKGVVAKDLHATTYLIVGDNSRFENYNNDSRTGCFWIGG